MAEKEADDPGVRLEKLGFSEEIAEEFNTSSMGFGAYVKTGFPEPIRRYRIVYESQQASLEHSYFWCYNHILQDQGYGDIIKVVDTFSSSENSSFWGLTEQRKGIQQDKASNFLAIIGKMVKELFQIVREIKIIKERLRLYKEAAEGKHASDIALKGYWSDFVDSGQKGGSGSNTNIYFYAQQLGFGTLPDLFFSTYVKDDDDVSSVVDDKAEEFNPKVREVLKRKLALYMAWRKETEKELKVRERFTLRYLRQHWAVIRMYTAWVRPYLRNVQKLTSPDKYDKNPELIGSFEGALMEIEILAKKAPEIVKDKKSKTEIKIYPVILATFNYRVSPQMAFNAEGGNRGALHVGRIEMSFRAYTWTGEEVNNYIKYREEETMELIGMVDSSVKAAMEALGDDLNAFLKESGEDMPEPEKKEEKKKEAVKNPTNLFEPFMAIFSGFKEMALMPFDAQLFTLKKASGNNSDVEDKKDRLRKNVDTNAFMIFKLYKKAHQMPAW